MGYRDWYLGERDKAAKRLDQWLRSQFPCGNPLCGAGGRCRCDDPAPRPEDQKICDHLSQRKESRLK